MTEESATGARRPVDAQPRGFFRVPPDVWDDEQAMDSFIESIVAHMDKVASRSRSGDEDSQEALD